MRKITMPSLIPPEEQTVSTTTQHTTRDPGTSPKTQSNLITLAGAVVLFSFLLPWVNLLGSNLSGLDIQKNVSSYKLIWLLPALAGATIFLNIAGQSTNMIRRLAGLCPFGILVYALNNLGTDLFQAIAIGGWLALLGGAFLIFIPNSPKPAKGS